MKLEDLVSCKNRCELNQRLAKIDPKKIKAYRAHREGGERNIFTKYYYEYPLWNRPRRGPPFEPEAPTARQFQWPPKYEGESLGYNETLKWEEAGFHLIAHVVDDDHNDTEYLGELWENNRKTTYPTDRISSDAIGLDYREYGGEYVPRYWFVPQVDVDGERKAHRGDKTRHEAWLRAQNTLRWNAARLKDYGQGWSNVGVEVKAFKHGIELGSAALWGIESDSDDYLVETAHDLASEAIKEAEDNLQSLREDRATNQGAVLQTYKVTSYDTLATTSGGKIVFGHRPTYITKLHEDAHEVKVIVAGEDQETEFTGLTPEQWRELTHFVTRPYEPEGEDDDSSTP